MAAYGALVSLMHIIDTLEKHPSPPISIHKEQLQSLTQNVSFLQEFLDAYFSPVVVDGHEADPLERRIADAVYAAEDVIESHIVDQIGKRSTIVEDEGFYQDLEKVIKEIKLIKKKIKRKIKRKITNKVKIVSVQAQPHQKPVAALTSSSGVKDHMMVGFDEVFLEVLDQLTGAQLSRQIISIVGMGGIGKTTLARNLFVNALVKEHFDIRTWTTISHSYNVREKLREVYKQARGRSCDQNENENLSDLSENENLSDLSENENLSDLSENELGEKLHKFLYGRRYLVIMDDMWSLDMWEKIQFFFPDNENGSRIIVTTRLSNVSSQLNGTYRVGMKFLDEATSWGLFCKTVFGKESCPLELENIGKNIVANCGGLPLSIATIGGLLSKSECTREYWRDIEQNSNSLVINSNDEFCLKILRMSYIYLPNYLKPCFLYMGVFEELCRIYVPILKKLWVSEGFLKPSSEKCMETVAQEYFEELVDRNLVVVDELGSIGNVKFCKIHDLLRDMCLKEVEKEKFYDVIRDVPLYLNSERRIVLKTAGLFTSEVLGSLQYARSIICADDIDVQLPYNCRLLRTFKGYDAYISYGNGAYFLDNVFELMNSRYLAIRVHAESKFPSSIDLLWNLHTLIVHCYRYLVVPIEIWKLHQLRHLVFEIEHVHKLKGGLILPDPPRGASDFVIMENLQTLEGVVNLFLNEDVVKRIPNVKKLYIRYNEKKMRRQKCLSYLQCLSKLESLRCSTEIGFGNDDVYWKWIRFPHSLKKLYVIGYLEQGLDLEDMMSKIGSLPLLEKFVLERVVFKTGKWETIEGQFPSLKFLDLCWCFGLDDWIVSDRSHFPLLQKLRLRLLDLKEIPSEVGEIAMLKSIYLERCRESMVVSAKKIVEEQKDLYGDQLDLHVLAIVRKREEALKKMASANFEVEVDPF